MIAPDCPHGSAAVSRVRDVVGRLAPGAPVEELRVEGADEALRLGMPGSPTVRVDGEDLEGEDAGPPGLACRRYDGSGVPPGWLIEAAVLRSLRPRHVLFLCVANSARSQMAEGIARALAPPGVRVSSAGSAPGGVRPEAVRALGEIGIDISGHRSKGLGEVEGEVDAVITLCAEEVCPVWLAPSRRLHWGLPDPAAVEGDEGQRTEAFRRVRDELLRRVRVLFRDPARD